ncbi:MAG TPA: hypothetical protein PKE29_07435 [Phycisphaerales bacterium]|nr:hypothetical protein [Phycisphaerales bacterium]
MAVKKTRTRSPAFIARVRNALMQDLARAGIAAEVTVEPIRGTKLHRITVIAGKFAKLRFTERQAVVWKIIDQVLDKKDQLFISMVLTLTPSEASGESAA